jgi:uncharacterized protein YbjT (DUF2867 family)
MQGVKCVLHLVGIISEAGEQTFENVHTHGTQNVVAAAQRAGVKRFVHMSALGTRANARRPLSPIQVGGGALASACIQGFQDAIRLGVPILMPRIHAIQTEGGYPLKRAYDRLAQRVEIPLFVPDVANGEADDPQPHVGHVAGRHFLDFRSEASRFW